MIPSAPLVLSVLLEVVDLFYFLTYKLPAITKVLYSLSVPSARLSHWRVKLVLTSLAPRK